MNSRWRSSSHWPSGRGWPWAKYGIQPGHGIYTDMNAIRRDEELDNLHSVYVDQWDWEKVITKEQRTEEYLKETVITIYNAVKNLGDYVNRLYRNIQTELPNEIYLCYYSGTRRYVS